MNKKLKKIEIIGFIFTCITGTLCHFVFEWSCNNYFVGLFCPVNESPWEHLKILWFPYLLFAIAEYFVLSKPSNFWKAKACGALTGIIFITVFYFSYSSIIGKDVIWLDILCFVLGVLLSYGISYFILKSKKQTSVMESTIYIVIICIVTAMFFIFTFAPPLIPLFRDPQTLTYGA